jgi:hypothetical protein
MKEENPRQANPREGKISPSKWREKPTDHRRHVIVPPGEPSCPLDVISFVAEKGEADCDEEFEQESDDGD